jgi:protein SCO1/2
MIAGSAACRPAPKELPRLSVIPDFQLTSVSSQGAPEALNAQVLRGAPWVADFIFTSCAGPCPLLSTRMAGFQKTLPPGIKLVSFTVDPDTDSPETLQAYARNYGADPRRWRFATGDKAGLYRLLRESFLLPVVEDPSAPTGIRVTHSTKFALVDGAMTVRAYYDGQDKAELASLERDAKSLLVP